MTEKPPVPPLLLPVLTRLPTQPIETAQRALPPGRPLPGYLTVCSLAPALLDQWHPYHRHQRAPIQTQRSLRGRLSLAIALPK